MDLLITWHDEASEGYTGRIPIELLQRPASSTAVAHEVLGPGGRRYIATCNIDPVAEIVDLDYRPFPQNERDMLMGALRLRFPSAERTGLPEAYWRGPGGVMFNEVHVTVSMALSSGVLIGGLRSLRTDDGRQINSHFSVEAHGSSLAVTIESRGGRKGGPNERNTDYSLGLRLLLERLSRHGFLLEKALLASQAALMHMPDEASRVVTPAGFNVPLQLTPTTDTASLARAFQKVLTTVGASPGAKGGNSTKRFSLVVHNSAGISASTLAGYLESGTHQGPALQNELYLAAATAAPFNPTDLEDARKRTLASIAVRQGQKQFRESLRLAYGDACAVTGCTVIEVLEAAHIVGYLGPETNHVQNGLLLRGDIHTLFDLGKLGVSPDSWRVVLHSDLQSGSYATLHGVQLRLPASRDEWPSADALASHLKRLA